MQINVPSAFVGARTQTALAWLVGGAIVVFVFIGALRSKRLVHDPPEDARVSVFEGHMVPLPFADRWSSEGEEMTLGQARALGVRPVDDGIDWTYTSRRYEWLFINPESGWSVLWAPVEYEGAERF